MFKIVLEFVFLIYVLLETFNGILEWKGKHNVIIRNNYCKNSFVYILTLLQFCV